MRSFNIRKCSNCNILCVEPIKNGLNLGLEEYNGVEYMTRKVDETDPLGYWACPNCETDSYLVDYPENK